MFDHHLWSTTRWRPCTPLPDDPELLQRELEPDSGHQGPLRSTEARIEGEKNWAHPGPQSKTNAYDLEHAALFQAIRDGRPVNNGDYMQQPIHKSVPAATKAKELAKEPFQPRAKHRNIRSPWNRREAGADGWSGLPPAKHNCSSSWKGKCQR